MLFGFTLAFWVFLAVSAGLVPYVIWMAMRADTYSFTQIAFIALLLGICIKLTYELFLLPH